MLWGVFGLITLIMVVFFWRKGWITILHKAEKLDFVTDAVEREKPKT